MTKSWGGAGGGAGNKKAAPMWSERLYVPRFGVQVYFFFTFTVAIPTTNWSLIIRTARMTTIRERVKIGFMLA